MSDVWNSVPFSIVHSEMREVFVPGILHNVPREQLWVGIFLYKNKKQTEEEKKRESGKNHKVTTNNHPVVLLNSTLDEAESNSLQK